MNYRRLIGLSRSGEFVYIGQHKISNGFGDYPEETSLEGLQEVFKKLFWFEKHLEDLIDTTVINF